MEAAEDVSGCLRRGGGLGTPKGGRQGVLHGPVRGQIGGMSRAFCLFAMPTSSAFGVGFEAVLGEAQVWAFLGGSEGRAWGSRGEWDEGKTEGWRSEGWRREQEEQEDEQASRRRMRKTGRVTCGPWLMMMMMMMMMMMTTR